MKPTALNTKKPTDVTVGRAKGRRMLSWVSAVPFWP